MGRREESRSRKPQGVPRYSPQDPLSTLSSADPPRRPVARSRVEGTAGMGRGVTRGGDQRRTGTVATTQNTAVKSLPPNMKRRRATADSRAQRGRHRQHPVEPPLSFCALEGQGIGSWSHTKDPGAHPRRLWLWTQRGTLAALCRRPGNSTPSTAMALPCHHPSTTTSPDLRHAGPAHIHPPPPRPPSGARLLLFGELLVGPLIVEAAQKGHQLVLRAGARGGRGGPVSPDRAAAAKVQSRE